MRDKVLAFVRQKGPCLPVEVKGCDSFLAKAYLSELVEKGFLKKNSEKIGDSFIYYAPGQESLVKEKVSGLGGEKTARIYAGKRIEVTPEIAKKREEFDSRLRDIERKEKKTITPQERIKESARKFMPKIEIIPKKPFFEAAKEAVRKVVSKPKQEPVKSSGRDDFVEKAIGFLVSNKIEILQKEEKAKSAELIVRVPSAVGMVKFFVKIKSKKKISKSELVAIYAEALEQRMPAILLTNGELAETSKKYLKSVGGFLRVKVF